MLQPNAVVSSAVRVSSGEAGPRVVEFEGGRQVRLDPDDPRSDGFARVLEGLSERGRPAYVEVDPDTEAVTRVLIPHVGHVVALTRERGVLMVEFDNSHAVHTIPKDAEDAVQLEAVLREAMDDRHPVLMVEDDVRHHVIDVRPFAPPDGGKPPFVPPPPPEPPYQWGKGLFAKWRPSWYVWYRVRWSRCLTKARAQEVFEAMAATTCDPVAVPPLCIPFMYPDNGCWARAHEMCRLLIGMGLSPAKVWIRRGPGAVLHAPTKNHPDCFVEWQWHVAPTVWVRGPSLLQLKLMVIDPSLFTTPVTPDQWKAAMQDASATLKYSGADLYLDYGATDPTYTDTAATLADHRLLLQQRSNAIGPPPYANC